MKDGIARLTWVTGDFNDRGLHRVMSEAVYADHEALGVLPEAGLSLAGVLRSGAVRGGAEGPGAADDLYKHGRRLRGPELVTTAEFNDEAGQVEGAE